MSLSFKWILLFYIMMVQASMVAQQLEATDKKGNIINVNNNRVTTDINAPSEPLENDVWLDTSDSENIKPRIWNGLSWIILDYTGTSGSIFYADTNGTITENNTQLFWDALNNRFGVGTNTPTHKLQVNGQVRATSFSNADGTEGSPAYRFNSDGDSGMFRAASNQIGLSTNGNEAIRIDANQNVGLGTDTPNAKLDIEGGTIRFSDYGAGAIAGIATNLLAVEADGDLIEVGLSALEINTNIYNSNGTLSANRSLIQDSFDLNFDSNTLVISGDDNNVGIGTNTPTNKLTINAEEPQLDLTDDTGVRFQLGYSESNNILSNSLSSQIITNTDGDIQYSSSTSNVSNHRFYTPNVGVPTERMRISTNGQVGIGTINPNAQLDIESTGVPLKITPSTTTPTGTAAGQMFMGSDGILYVYDGVRNKWLSVDRQNISWARGGLVTNQYLPIHNSYSITNGYRMLRNATITGVTAQSGATGSWQLLILRNNEITTTLFVTLSNEVGKHSNNITLDLNEGDYIKAYALGSNINSPIGSIEFAWRK